MDRLRPYLPFVSVIAGIAVFSLMDAAVKSAAIAVGAYSAILLRSAVGTLLALPLWIVPHRRQRRTLARNVMRLHMLRGVTVAVMAPLFFFGLVRIPLAEGIALSFIAPLIALYLASVMLGEQIRPTAIWASVMGILGVAIIAAGRIGEGTYDHDAMIGVAAVLVSAVAYAINLVLQRRQAMLAGPIEIALFQNLCVGLCLLPLAPWLLVSPDAGAMRDIVLGALLSTIALALLAWGYARAEAQALLPIEYTAFLWAALFGWLWFGETVNAATVGGAVLIVIGCLIAARRHTEQTAL